MLDDFADTPQLHKPGHFFHQGPAHADQYLGELAEAEAHQRSRAGEHARAGRRHLSALLPKEQLYRLYEQATREPYSFLFVYYLKPRNEMFYKRFEERFALEKDADGSAQLPGPEAVRQLHADQREV